MKSVRDLDPDTINLVLRAWAVAYFIRDSVGQDPRERRAAYCALMQDMSPDDALDCAKIAGVILRSLVGSVEEVVNVFAGLEHMAPAHETPQ